MQKQVKEYLITERRGEGLIAAGKVVGPELPSIDSFYSAYRGECRVFETTPTGDGFVKYLMLRGFVMVPMNIAVVNPDDNR